MIPQESALGLVLINIAVIDSPCGKQPVPMRCEGDTSWEEATKPLQDPRVTQRDNKKGALKEGRKILTHLERGAIPRPAGEGVLGRTRVQEEEKGGEVERGPAVRWLLLVQRHQGKPR